MTSRGRASREAIAVVARTLGDLRDTFVFVGGTVAALYPLEEGFDVRETVDVDCIVSVATTHEYYELAAELYRRGFGPCTDDGAPLCRQVLGSMRVDVMPSKDTPIGASNRWFPEAVANATTYDADGVVVRAVTPIYFVATKLEAFRSRGRGDFIASHDLEDLLNVIAGLAELRTDIETGEGVAASVRAELVALADVESFVDAVPGHFEGHAIGQDRARRIARWLRALRASAHEP